MLIIIQDKCMSGFLFVVVLIMSILFIGIGIVSYISDKIRLTGNIEEIRIFGLKASTFYIMSMASLVILCCLYENPVSATWRAQHRLDSIQSEKIDSLEKRNSVLNENIDDLKKLLELHRQLDEKIINTMNKRDIVVINNNRIRNNRRCMNDSMHCNKRKICGKKKCDTM